MLNCSYSSILAAFLFRGIVYTTNVLTNEDMGSWWFQSEWQGALVWWLVCFFGFSLILGGWELFCTRWCLCPVLQSLFFLFPLLWAQSNQDVWPQVFSTVGGLWTGLSDLWRVLLFCFSLFIYLCIFFGDICFLSVFYYRHSSWKTSVFHMCSVLQKVWRLVQSTHGCYL